MTASSRKSGRVAPGKVGSAITPEAIAERAARTAEMEKRNAASRAFDAEVNEAEVEDAELYAAKKRAAK